MSTECYIGLMSGTSMDGVDAVLLELDPPHLGLIASHSAPYSQEIQDRLMGIVDHPHNVSLDAVGELDTMLGERFAKAAIELIDKAGPAAGRVQAIGSHGQTIRHAPGAPQAFTWQIGDPNIIAARTGITTVADFRRRDVALGGEGAPLTPAFHAAVFAHPTESRVILNVGGMANVTLLPVHGPVSGFDTGPGNVLMDAWIRLHKNVSWDTGGVWAASGNVDPQLLRALLADEYFNQLPPKSTGREHFNMEWLRHQLSSLATNLRPEDVQATVCELTARSVADAIHKHAQNPERVVVCGGGAHNDHLMARLAHLLKSTAVATTADHGLDPDWVEAAAFAWLAHRTLRGASGNLPVVTGACSVAVLGAVYHGAGVK